MRRSQDRRSEAAKAYRNWYGLKRWQTIREAQLAAHPLCRMCLPKKLTPATVVDHVEPHRGDPVKFWGGPFQSLCAPHHDGAKQAEEARGYSGECDATGWPTDPRHPANA